MNTEKTAYVSASTKPLFRGVQVVWYLFGLLEALLALRFFLRFAGANPAAEFTHFMYGVSAPFLAPFTAVFPRSVIEGRVFEWTTILAIFVYWFIAMAIVRLFLMSRTVSTTEAASHLEREDV